MKHKKIGLFFSLMLVIGSVVGIGIFFKNGSISRTTGGDGVTWLLAWIVGGLISLTAALSFAEIGSFKNTKLTGLSNWAFKVGGSRLGYFTSISFSTFYFGALNALLGIFGSEVWFTFIGAASKLDTSHIHSVVHIIIGLLFMIVFMLLNYASTRTSGQLQSFFTILKFVPILVALFIGIVLPNVHNAGGVNAFTIIGKSFSIKGLVAALPAVLFAYDAFLGNASMSHKIKKPNKNVPKAIFFGMAFVVVIYTLIALSSILHNQGNIGGLLSDTLPKSVAAYISPIIWFFILISTFGVLNGLSAAFINETHNTVKAKLYFGSRALIKRFGLQKTFWIYITIIFAFWGVLIYIPAIVLNTDILIDAVSNYPTLFFFNIYALVILLYAIKRHKISETNKINKWVFYISAALAVTGIAVAEIVYLVVIFTFLGSNTTNPNGWGVFYDQNKGGLIPNYLPVLYYFLNLILLFSLPAINYALEKAVFKNNLVKNFSTLIMLDAQEEKEEQEVVENKEEQSDSQTDNVISNRLIW
ncbi:APC family permease [Mycoplasma sp. 4423]